MTIQEAIKKLTSSEDLKKKAIEALKSGKGNEFLKENGIDFTLEDFKNAAQKIKSGELSKEELNLAAGGGCDNGCEIALSLGTFGLGCAVSSIVESFTDKCI